jgi:SAM-dependent methyltransferase
MNTTLAEARQHLTEIAVRLRSLAVLLSTTLGLTRPGNDPGAFEVFLTPDAHAINAARQDHLATLGLALENKSVLEVGAGIGLHTTFFLQRGCNVLVTDGNAENVAEIRRRHPGWRTQRLDLEGRADPDPIGEFDLVYCYGLLYHLGNPEQAIHRLAAVCRGQILLETCVALGEASEVHFLRDPRSHNQAVSGIGCRPTRSWVMQQLRRHFGYAYATRTQPDHGDFETDWRFPETRMIYRAVFVGSKIPLALSTLTEELPQQQTRAMRPAAAM